MAKIMIVDDEPDQLSTVRISLERLGVGYEIIPADSGKKCFELLRDNQIPDLILLDIMMPEMNGWEVHEKLKQTPEWRDIPVIFVSAVQDKTSKITGSIIADDYIDKPFETRELREKIDNILKKLSFQKEKIY